MTRNKLAKIKQDLAALRRAQAKASDIQSLAKRLGRKKKNRGKEPTYESEVLPHLYPLTIPHHGGKDLAPGTKRSILDRIEEDVFAWELKLDEDDSEENGGDSHDNGDGSG